VVDICEHRYGAEDPRHPGYSLIDTDLFAAVGQTGEAFSIRMNKDDDVYEIFDFDHPLPYTDESVIFEGNIHDVIREANQLEERAVGHGSFGYGYDPALYGCPEDVAREFPEIMDDLDR
jgi:hypothetical protein